MTSCFPEKQRKPEARDGLLKVLSEKTRREFYTQESYPRKGETKTFGDKDLDDLHAADEPTAALDRTLPAETAGNGVNVLEERKSCGKGNHAGNLKVQM